MTESQRQAVFNLLAVAFLLLATALGDAWVMVGGALSLIVIGMVLVPRQRGRGVLTAAVAAVVAFAASMLVRSLSW